MGFGEKLIKKTKAFFFSILHRSKGKTQNLDRNSAEREVKPFGFFRPIYCCCGNYVNCKAGEAVVYGTAVNHIHRHGYSRGSEACKSVREMELYLSSERHYFLLGAVSRLYTNIERSCQSKGFPK